MDREDVNEDTNGLQRESEDSHENGGQQTRQRRTDIPPKVCFCISSRRPGFRVSPFQYKKYLFYFILF